MNTMQNIETIPQNSNSIAASSTFVTYGTTPSAFSTNPASINFNQDKLYSLYVRFIAYLDAKPKTIETYTKSLRQFFKYLRFKNIIHPKREDVIAFREDIRTRGHKPSTVQAYVTAVRLFFNWTNQEGLYPNIAEHLKGAKIDKNHKKDYLTARQTRGIIENVNRDTQRGLRDYALLILMTTGGLRTVEVIRANAGDLRALGDSTVLYVQGKGHEEKSEYIKITPHTEEALRTYLKARGTIELTDPLFVSEANRNRNKILTVRSVSRIVKKAFIANGFNTEKLSAHSLRHTAITLSLISGKDITETMQFARHTSIATTMIYNHALDKAKNRCGEATEHAIWGQSEENKNSQAGDIQ